MSNLTLLFLKREGEILLAMKKRGFCAGCWNGVGGKVEPGETVEEAMLRECMEEINVKPIDYYQLSEIEFTAFHEGAVKTFKVSVFACYKWKGKPTETEEMSPKWFDFSEIPYEDMWPDDKYWLKYVLKDKKFSARFTLDQEDNIISFNINELSVK